MKHVRGYKHFHNNKYSDYNKAKSSINRVVENSYREFLNSGKSSNYFEIGKKDNRNIFELCLTSGEYSFLKENLKVDEINSIMMESISLTISLSNDDLLNEGFIDSIKKKIGDSYDKAVNWVDDKIDKAVEFGKVAVKKMKDIIANITEIVTDLYKQVKSSLTQMWAFLGTQFSKLMEKMKGGVKKAGNAKIKALVSLLESDNALTEAEEAKKDFAKIKAMITGGKLAKQEDVENELKSKAEDFKNYSADELEKMVVNDVSTVQAESLITSLKGLIIENGPSILSELSQSLKVNSNINKINEKEGVSSKSIFSWVLEGISVIISWKSKLIEKLTKVGTNFLMNFMSNVARAGQGVKYILMGQIVAFVIAFIYELQHLIHEVGHGVDTGTKHESKVYEADDQKPVEQNQQQQTQQQKPEQKPVDQNQQKTEKPAEQKDQNTQKTEQTPADQKQDNTEQQKAEETKKAMDAIKNMSLESLSPDKIITAIDWKALKFAGLSVVFTLAIKTLFPQLSLLFTIIGVMVCSFELMETVCGLSKSHSGVCKALHSVDHFATDLFKGQKAAPAH